MKVMTCDAKVSAVLWLLMAPDNSIPILELHAIRSRHSACSIVL